MDPDSDTGPRGWLRRRIRVSGGSVSPEIELYQHGPLTFRLRRCEGPFLRCLDGETFEVAARAGLVRGGGDDRTLFVDAHADNHPDRSADRIQSTLRDVRNDFLDGRRRCVWLLRHFRLDRLRRNRHWLGRDGHPRGGCGRRRRIGSEAADAKPAQQYHDSSDDHQLRTSVEARSRGRRRRLSRSQLDADYQPLGGRRVCLGFGCRLRHCRGRPLPNGLKKESLCNSSPASRIDQCKRTRRLYARSGRRAQSDSH